MANADDTKVFISWSGDAARAAANALRDWVPLVVGVTPWMSDADIALGQRGLNQIEAELQDTNFGIIIVTPENENSPWLNFEAGAMSKVVAADIEQRVVPMLLGISSFGQVEGPLRQFQGKVLNKEGVSLLVASLTEVAQVDAALVKTRFEAFWPRLEAILHSIEVAPVSATKAARKPADMMDEILMHVRFMRSELDTSASQNLLSSAVQSTVVVDAQISKSTVRIINDVAKKNSIPVDSVGLHKDGELWISSPMAGTPAGKAFEKELAQRLDHKFFLAPF